MDVFEFVPGAGALPITFGMSVLDVRRMLGTPKNERPVGDGEIELEFDEVSILFGPSSGGVVEIGFSPRVHLLVDGMDIFNDDSAFPRIVAAKGGAVEYLGFVAFPALGIEFTGLHDGQIHERAARVFIPGRIEKFRSRMRPYSIPVRE